MTDEERHTYETNLQAAMQRIQNRDEEIAALKKERHDVHIPLAHAVRNYLKHHHQDRDNHLGKELSNCELVRFSHRKLEAQARHIAQLTLECDSREMWMQETCESLKDTDFEYLIDDAMASTKYIDTLRENEELKDRLEKLLGKIGELLDEK